MYDRNLVIEIFAQILEAAGRIERRMKTISSPDDFLLTEAGGDRLDAICMMLIAIGESLTYIDKVTKTHYSTNILK